jgi:hypothetical protein
MINNKNISGLLNPLMEKLLDELQKNIIWLNQKTQIFLITAYKNFILDNSYSPQSIYYQKVGKIVNAVSEDLSMSNLHKLHFPEVIELLNTFSQFFIQNSEFYLEVEKILGKNINEISPKDYVLILDAFVKTNNFREKFIILMQNKVYLNKDSINKTDLCKIMRIFAVLRLQNETIFEKMQDHLLKFKHDLQDYEICDLVFAYSNLKMQNNFVLNDMQEFIDHKTTKWLQNRKFDIIIDIFDSYLIAKKGEKEFIEKMKEILVESYKVIRSDNIDDVSVFKLVHVFYCLKLPSEQVEKFDNLLRNKFKYYTRDEYMPLFKFLSELNYENKETLDILQQLEKVDNNYMEKLGTLKKYNLI